MKILCVYELEFLSAANKDKIYYFIKYMVLDLLNLDKIKILEKRTISLMA